MMAQPRIGLPRLVGLLLACGLLAAPPALGSVGVCAGQSISPAAGPGATAASRVVVRLVGAGALARSRSAAPPAALLADIHAEQGTVASEITSAIRGATVERSYALAFNGLAVRLPPGEDDTYAALAALPGVAAVYADEPFAPTLFASADQIGAPPVWEALGGVNAAGEGIKIAVLDSGIDVTHSMFAAEGLAFPAGFPRGDARYTTAKVPAARMYIRPDDPPLPGEQYPLPGADGSSHGTHLAAIAAGRPVTATYHGVTTGISGVAPRAWLLNYRLFYPSVTGREVAYTVEVLAAIEDAVADGADMLLAGWAGAGPTAPFASPVVMALEAAMDAGCVVVAAAGNDGPDLGTASRVPGGSGRIITVGAVRKHEEIQTSFVDVTGPEPVLDRLQDGRFAAAEFGAPLASAIGPLPFVPVELVSPGGDPYACDALSEDSLQGSIAIIRRGACSFGDKAYHVQQAGAVAVVIVNDGDALISIACAGPYCGPGAIRIPVVLVTHTFGSELIAWGTLYRDATLRIDPGGRLVQTDGDVVSEFSARGPAYQRYLKPDLVAPGEAILAAAASSPMAVTQLSGTSVAAAHVAGAAALLRQLHPDWGHDRVKAALVATATTTVGGLAEQIGYLQWGAGRIDLAAASGVTLVVEPSSVSLGQVAAGAAVPVSLRLSDLRDSGQPVMYRFAAADETGLTLTLPGEIAVAPGQEATVTVTVRAGPAASAGPAVATLIVQGAAWDLRVPVWAHVLSPASTGSVLLVDNDLSFFEGYSDYAGRVADALEDAGHTYAIWEADALFDHPQTIPDLAVLQEYRAVIWVTGDSVHPSAYYAVQTPLTRLDQAVITAYLDGGGRLLAIGKNLAQASDVNEDPDPTWGRSILYHHYLGAHWLQGSLTPEDQEQHTGTLRAVGLPDTFLAGRELALGRAPNQPAAQESVDEVGVGGAPDGTDLDLAQAVLVAVGGEAVGRGYVGVAKSCPPRIAQPFASCSYRTLYYSFGPEGLGAPDTLGLAELLHLSLSWLQDSVAVSLPDVVWAPHEPLGIRAEATSSEGDVRAFEWLIDTGAETRQMATTQPDITLQWASAGSYTVSVTAVDSYYHRAVAAAPVRILAGGNSTLAATPDAAAPGDEIVLTVTVRNSTAEPLPMDVRLPLPGETAYVTHQGGAFEAGELRLSAVLEPDAEQVAALRVRIAESAQGLIRAEAELTAGGEAFRRSASVLVGSRLRLPLVLRGATLPAQ